MATRVIVIVETDTCKDEVTPTRDSKTIALTPPLKENPPYDSNQKIKSVWDYLVHATPAVNYKPTAVPGFSGSDFVQTDAYVQNAIFTFISQLRIFRSVDAVVLHEMTTPITRVKAGKFKVRSLIKRALTSFSQWWSSFPELPPPWNYTEEYRACKSHEYYVTMDLSTKKLYIAAGPTVCDVVIVTPDASENAALAIVNAHRNRIRLENGLPFVQLENETLEKDVV